MSQNIKILFVEDDETDFILAREIIKRISVDDIYDIEWKQNYEDGLREVLKRKHDLYFIDYELAGENGLDLIKTAQVNDHTGPFIILSGSDDQSVYDQAVKAGVYEYVLKTELSSSMLDRAIKYALDRKRVEDELTQEKEFSSFILSEIPNMVISVDYEGQISSINPFVTQITGKSEKELIGQNWKLLIADPEQRENLVYNVNDDNQIGFDAELIDHAEKKRRIHWSILKNTKKTKNKNALSFVLSGKDMTDQLEKESHERQRQKTEALGHLAGGVAHEINNLLQPILFCADIIDTNATEEKTKNAANKIVRNTVNASRIVDDILTYARRDSVDQSNVKLNQTIFGILDLMEDMIPQGVTIDASQLESQIGDQDIDVYLSTTDLFRVIKNTALNSAQAMNNEGQVVITSESCHLKNPDKKLQLSPGPYAKICISDTGDGIDPEIVEKIFDPFFTTKDAGKGTGLGLSIAYNMVKNWKGAIDVESTLGEGTIFSFYVPILPKSD